MNPTNSQLTAVVPSYTHFVPDDGRSLTLMVSPLAESAAESTQGEGKRRICAAEKRNQECNELEIELVSCWDDGCCVTICGRPRLVGIIHDGAFTYSTG